MKAVLVIVLYILSLCSARSLFQSSAAVISAPSTVPTGGPTALVSSGEAQNLPKDWPPKAPNTLRFALVLEDLNKTTVQETYWGYKFWATSVNDNGGILNSTAIGYTTNVLVDLQIAYNVIFADHGTVLRDAADLTIGDADFLLGGATGDAYEDQKVAQDKQRITMLCCHGPPLVYTNATKAAENNKTRNFLFGIHVSSEKYVDKIIRNIAVNGYSKKIALFSTFNGSDPESNPDATSDLFSKSTCDAARTQLEDQKRYERYENFPEFYDVKVSSDVSSNETALEEFLIDEVIKMKGDDQGKNRTDTVIGCTNDSTGKILLKALNTTDVRLRTLFLTVAPTSSSTVNGLAKSGIVLEHILSAGQWHPEVAWGAPPGRNGATEPQIMWQNATDFSNKYEAFMKGQNQTETLRAATYTIASAAAAGNALQLAIHQAFQVQICNLSTWNGDAQALFSTQWNCIADDAAQQPDSKIGLDRIHSALRSLSTSTFFGNIDFDENQRNIGRDALTLQLLKSDNRKDGSTLASIDFGYDFPEANMENVNDLTAKLIQEASETRL
ncbi:hypothetical protein Ndes2437B_g03958 [Nannochloris sp. 'desiccata']